MLEELFISKVRVKILTLFFTKPTERHHVRGITRAIGEEINAVRRELDRLSHIGLLGKEAWGNRLYYFLKPDFVYFPELMRLIGKETGLGKVILANHKNLGDIKYAFMAGRLLRGGVASSKDIDLLIIGKVTLSKLSAIIKDEEKKYAHEINYTVFSEEEFAFRKKRHDPFIMTVLMQERVMLIGNEEEMLRME